MLEVHELSQQPFFKKLSEAEITCFIEYFGAIHLNEAEIFFYENEPADKMGFLLSGHLDVVKQSLQGEEVVVGHIVNTGPVGDFGVLDELPRSATIRAATHTKLALLTRENFDALCEEQPKLAIKLLRYLFKHMSLNLRRSTAFMADTKAS